MITKEALIKEMVHSCNWDFAQNRGKKHSNTARKRSDSYPKRGGITSIFNNEFGQNNIADVCQRFNQGFLKINDKLMRI